MQLPAPPTGPPPAEKPAERSCPSCGASNGRLAAFCWQCYRQFAPVAGSSVPMGPGSSRGPAGLRAVVVEAPAPAPSPARATGRFGGVAATILVGIVAAAAVFFFLNRGPGVELPDSFGGLERITDPQVDALLDAFRGQIDAEGFQADVGIYGTTGIPSAGLVWFLGDDLTDPEQAFSQLESGFNSTAGSATLGQTTTETIGGVRYVCAAATGNPTANICLWHEDEVFWSLFDLSGGRMNATQRLAVAAHDAV